MRSHQPDETPPRWQWVLFAVVLLQIALFVPGFAFRRTPADLLPFFPAEHPYGPWAFEARSVVEYVKALLWRRVNGDVFRLTFETSALLVVVVWSARWRFARVVVAAATGVWFSLLFFFTYHAAFRSFFVRPPAVAADWPLLLNLSHYLSAQPWFAWPATVLSVLGGSAAIVWLSGTGFSLVRRIAQARPLRARALSVASLVFCLGSLAWFGPEREDPVGRTLLGVVRDNVRASQVHQARASAMAHDAPDVRYDALSEIKLARRPNVMLLMVEAYGEVLATWDMTPAYRALLERVTARLERRGLHAASFYSAAPVYGGTSWFSISTVHTGVLIDRPDAYRTLMEHRAQVPTLTRFMAEHGYKTFSLQPGSVARPGLDLRDWLEHDTLIDGDDLAYRGKRYGFGGIPDQLAVASLRETFLAAPSPRYLFFMTVSTHFPWGDQVPPYVADPAAFNDGTEQPFDDDERWPPLAEKATISDDYRRSYFQSIEYEWRVLCDLLDADTSENLIVLVVGDHQPRLESNPPGEVTLNTPVHVLATDRTFADRFVARGAQPGLFARPGGGPVFQHEGLFSLFVAELEQAYGVAPFLPRAQWSPDGANPSALRR